MHESPDDIFGEVAQIETEIGSVEKQTNEQAIQSADRRDMFIERRIPKPSKLQRSGMEKSFCTVLCAAPNGARHLTESVFYKSVAPTALSLEAQQVFNRATEIDERHDGTEVTTGKARREKLGSLR